MNISLKNLLLLMLVVPALASCIRDNIEECPPLRVEIVVKDKNYSNVDMAAPEERRPDNLAFREYVPTLFYMLRDANTGEVIEEQGVFDVKGDDKSFAIDFCPCLPHGKYIITVWGGIDNLEQLSADRLSMPLHYDRAEGNDTYLVNDTLVYDAYNYNYTLGMQRTKGKLNIIAENLPDSYVKADIDVSNIYNKVNSNFKYSDHTSVANHKTAATAPLSKIATIMAPSVMNGKSVLEVNFYKPNPTDAYWKLSPEDVNITMERNKITVLKYVFNPNLDNFIIYIKVNDNWEEIHGMILD